jgi:hypothetical protein
MAGGRLTSAPRARGNDQEPIDMTPEVNLLYSLFANHPAEGREIANIGKRRGHGADASTGGSRRLGRIGVRRARTASAPSSS